MLPQGKQLRIAGARLPASESADDLLTAVTPWLAAARKNRSSRLRHGPKGADAQHQRSCLVAPMLLDERVLGVVYADIDGALGRFDAGHRTLLTRLAAFAAAALDKQQRLDSTQRQAEADALALQLALAQQTATSEVLNVIASSVDDAQPVFDKIIDSAAQLFPNALALMILQVDAEKLLHVGGIRFVGDASGPFAPQTARQKERDIAQAFPSPLAGTATELAIRTGLAEIPDMHNAIDVPGLQRFAKIVGYNFAALFAPLVWESQGIGSIAVLSAKLGPFGDKQHALLKTFADQAVIAIQNARLFNETQEALAHQTASADILRVISSSPTDVQPVFEAIVGTAVKHLGCDLALVQTVSGDTYSPQAMATPAGLTPVPGAQVMPVDPAANFPSRAIRCKAMLHVSDWSAVELPPHEQVRHQQLGLNSALYLPLLRGDGCVGVLVLGSRKANAFNPKAIALAESFRDQALIAIENTRLFNETKEALERQTATAAILGVIAQARGDVQPVLDAIVHSARELAGGLTATLWLVEGGRGTLLARTRTRPGADDGLLAQDQLVVAQTYLASPAITLEPLVVPDIEAEPQINDEWRQIARSRGYRSIVVVPMLRDGACTGLVSVTRQAPGPFPDHLVTQLQTFADQAVIAIQNARLFNETQEALSRQTASAEILNVISNSMADPQPVFDAVVSACQRLFGGRAVNLLMAADGRIQRVASAQDGSIHADAVNAWPLDRTSIAGDCVLRADVVSVLDSEQAGDRYPRTKELAATFGWRSALCVPLLHGDRALGCIAILRSRTGSFAPKEVALAETFADQAVIAIQNARLFNETKDALERQTATAEVLQVISSSVADTQPVFDKIVDSVRRLFGGQDIIIQLLDGQGRIHLGAYHGPYREQMERVYPIPLAGSSAELALNERRVKHYPDVLNGPDVPDGLRGVVARVAGETGSMIQAPMLWDQRGIGTINVFRKPPRPFSDKEQEQLKTFADQAVIAIQNAKMFRETNEALERQTATAEILKVIASSPSDVQPVFDAIARSSNQLLGGWSTMVARIEDDALQLVAFTSTTPEGDAALKRSFPIPLQTFSVGAAIRRGEMVPIVDTELVDDALQNIRELARARGYRSMLFCPLVREGQSVGMISVTRREPGPFAPHQVALLQTFADQAVIAIENVRLFNETQESLQQQKASAEVLAVISNSMADAQPVFEKILDSCKHLFGGDELDVLLVDEQGQLDIAAYRGVARDIVAATFPAPVERTPAGRALRERRVMHWPDLIDGDDVPGVLRKMAKLIGYRSMVFAPMLWNERGIGAIGVARSTGPFKPKELAMLQTFADQAVIAIQNARLFNETKEALEQQTASAEVLTVIGNSVSDAAPVFERILDSGRRILNTNYVNLGLIGDDGRVHVDVNRAAQFPGDPMYPKVVAWLHATYPAPVRETMHGYCAHKRAVLNYPDVQHGPDVPAPMREKTQWMGNISLLYVPLIWKGQGIGAFEVARIPMKPFTDKEIALIKTFADQAVIAIQNAKMFKETQEARAAAGGSPTKPRAPSWRR